MGDPRSTYPYSVRQRISSTGGPTRHVVVRNPGGDRITEYPPCTQLLAWRVADRLNVIAKASELSDLLAWDYRWRAARDRYRAYLPYRGRCRQERIEALNRLDLTVLGATQEDIIGPQ